MRTYIAFAGWNGALVVTFVAMAVFPVLMFPNLPAGGELLHMKSGYSYDVVMASIMARYPRSGPMEAAESARWRLARCG